MEGGTDLDGIGEATGSFDAELGYGIIKDRGEFGLDGVEADVAAGEFGLAEFESLAIEPDADRGDDTGGILSRGGDTSGPGGLDTTEAGGEDLDAHAGAERAGGVEEFAIFGIEDEGGAIAVGKDDRGGIGEIEVEPEGGTSGGVELDCWRGDGGVVGNLKLGFVVVGR